MLRRAYDNDAARVQKRCEGRVDLEIHPTLGAKKSHSCCVATAGQAGLRHPGRCAERKLCGYRALSPADRTAAIEAILHVAQLAADFPQLAEIEINPLFVLPAGVVAIDVLIRVACATARSVSA